jgi:hypothetical protein
LGWRSGLPAAGLPDNDTRGKVPGDPNSATSQAAKLYKNVQRYRSYHQGNYPSNAAVLIVDVMNNYKQYGYKSQQDVDKDFKSNDSKYSDNAAARQNPQSFIPWIICSERPDGEPLSAAKQPGTRDVVAYNALYYHQEIRHFNGTRDTMQPVGFYVVVWDDGQVESIPFEKTLFVQRKGTNRTYMGFPGQTGIPSTALPYDTYYKRVRRQ